MHIPFARCGLAVLLCAIMVGCGGGPTVYPVSGTATVDGKPLAGFVLSFIVDEKKGHDFPRVDCSARVGADGRYSVLTDDGFKQYRGAPSGWYKVTIYSPEDNPVPVNPKYLNMQTTPLAIQVGSSPAAGAYDLKFTK